MTILWLVEVVFGIIAVYAMMDQIFFRKEQTFEKFISVRIDIAVMLIIVLIFHYLRTK